MASHPDLEDIARTHGRYDPEAYAFIGQSLRHAAALFGKDKATEVGDRHLSAHQLVSGVLDLAVERYGLMAELVLQRWGIRASADVGRITFALIAHDVFSKQDNDRIEDFEQGPDFHLELADVWRRRLALHA